MLTKRDLLLASLCLMVIAGVVILKYLELKVYLTQDRKWKARFHHNMFDAVALGMMVVKNKVSLKSSIK